MKHIVFLLLLATLLGATGCTKLNEKYEANLTEDQVSSGSSSVTALLKNAYNSMRGPYQAPWGLWALQEFPSDEAIVPTRAGDWDDNGAWRALHLHKWNGDHERIRDVYRDLTGVAYAATDVLRFSPTPQQEAEARFIRAFANFSLVDAYDQVPYRDPGEKVTLPARVRKGTEVIDYIIIELNAIMPNLPAGTTANAFIANKNAAKVLLMKCYLNKGVYANRQSPAFAADDMAKVITLADEIIATNAYQLTNNYFDNFAPNNATLSLENIFTAQNIGGSDGSGGTKDMWVPTLHYNQSPAGYNGFSSLSDFYDKYEATDTRRGGSYPGVTNVSGIRVGFLVGQQYDQNNVALKDRKNNPLSFTREVSIIERGNNLEVTGIRVIKYPIDYNNATGVAENDWVYFRYSDVLLMKAEALLRSGGSAAVALTLANQVRLKRGASAWASVTLAQLLDERGREFFWEGHRRTDLVRFGKYLEPWQEKPTDDPKYLVFSIPNQQLGVNPNLTQNPGY